MYDIKRRKGFIEPTVKTLIEVLKQYPQDAKITICGDSYCFIHCEQDNSCVTLDNEELGDCYPEENFEEFDFSTMTSGEEILKKHDNDSKYINIINSIIEDLSNKSTESTDVIIEELINDGCMTEENAKEIINTNKNND